MISVMTMKIKVMTSFDDAFKLDKVNLWLHECDFLPETGQICSYMQDANQIR